MSVFLTRSHCLPASFLSFVRLPVSINPKRPCSLKPSSSKSIFPHDHRARSVVSLRDDLLEVEVLEGMVLGQHREMLLFGVEGWTLGHRKALQRAADLEPHVVVGTRRIVQMDDVATVARGPTAVLAFRGEGLVRP